MMFIKRFSESNEEYIIRASKKLYSQGHNIIEISTILNEDPINIYNAIIKDKQYTITDSDIRDGMIILHDNGLSYQQIGYMVDRSATCVKNRIKSDAKYVKTIGYILNSKQLQNIKKLYKNGYTLKYIANLYDIKPKCISNRLKRCGIWEPNHCNKVPLSLYDKRRIKSLLKQGLNYYQIANKIGRPYCIVCKYK